MPKTRRVDGESFPQDWTFAKGERGLKEALLKEEHFLYVSVKTGKKSEPLLGMSLKEVHLPSGNLIPVIRRDGQNIIPRGDTVLQEGERLTILGEPEFLKEFRKKYRG
ncbi:MAG: TrkA C-terminal domain-containing protein [Bacteroidetes bacterium]|nr:TrkA C-terminal domain-containing protein [Bacteroidota bacterium]